MTMSKSSYSPFNVTTHRSWRKAVQTHLSRGLYSLWICLRRVRFPLCVSFLLSFPLKCIFIPAAISQKNWVSVDILIHLHIIQSSNYYLNEQLTVSSRHPLFKMCHINDSIVILFLIGVYFQMLKFVTFLFI